MQRLSALVLLSTLPVFGACRPAVSQGQNESPPSGEQASTLVESLSFGPPIAGPRNATCNCGPALVTCPADTACLSFTCSTSPCGCFAHYSSTSSGCSDGVACTYGDHCDGNGSCVGGATCVAPSNGSLLTCDGTSACPFSCNAGYHSCGARSCALDTDPDHCGVGANCGACPAAPANGYRICVGGTSCDFGCNAGSHRCGAACASDSDPSACGASCTPCPTGGLPANSQAACVNGTCGWSCLAGYKSCNSACIPVATPCPSNCGPGTHDCSGVCLQNSSPASCGSNCGPCPTPPTNGTATCDGTSCGVACNGGFHACNGGTVCADNTSPQSCGTSCTPCSTTTNGSATCDGSSCGLVCGAGFKKCQPPGTTAPTCIASGGCCIDGDCASPPNSQCYGQVGSCAAGVCVYPFKSGSCDADGTRCTPNDTCVNGVCQADAAHQVVCVPRDCNTAVCDATTGDCRYSPISAGSACGGANGCYPAGSLCDAAGNCMGAAKDCSSTMSLDQCQTPVCNATNGMCSANNRMNGIDCTLADKCVLGPKCSGGSCLGTPKSCPPNTPCQTNQCNPMTGDCESNQLAAGTPCAPDEACQRDHQCDPSGNCAGTFVADGTPCPPSGECDGISACRGGMCTCITTDALADAGSPGDLGMGKKTKGCTYANSDGPIGARGLLLLLLWLGWWARKRVSASDRSRDSQDVLR